MSTSDKCYIHTLECYLTIKRNQLSLRAGWVSRHFTEWKKSVSKGYCTIPFTWHPRNDKIAEMGRRIIIAPGQGIMEGKWIGAVLQVAEEISSWCWNSSLPWEQQCWQKSGPVIQRDRPHTPTVSVRTDMATSRETRQRVVWPLCMIFATSYESVIIWT